MDDKEAWIQIPDVNQYDPLHLEDEDFNLDNVHVNASNKLTKFGTNPGSPMLSPITNFSTNVHNLASLSLDLYSQWNKGSKILSFRSNIHIPSESRSRILIDTDYRESTLLADRSRLIDTADQTEAIIPCLTCSLSDSVIANPKKLKREQSLIDLSNDLAQLSFN